MELDFGLTKAATAGARMTLKHPISGVDLTDGAGQPCVLILHGVDSEQYRKATRYLQRRAAEKVKRTKRFEPQTPEDVEEGERYLYTACTSGWEHCSYGGVTAFSPELIRAFYADQGWALEQVKEFIEGRASFFEDLKTT